jgi:hypothetical protein
MLPEVPPPLAVPVVRVMFPAVPLLVKPEDIDTFPPEPDPLLPPAMIETTPTLPAPEVLPVDIATVPEAFPDVLPEKVVITAPPPEALDACPPCMMAPPPG